MLPETAAAWQKARRRDDAIRQLQLQDLRVAELAAEHAAAATAAERLAARLQREQAEAARLRAMLTDIAPADAWGLPPAQHSASSSAPHVQIPAPLAVEPALFVVRMDPEAASADASIGPENENPPPAINAADFRLPGGRVDSVRCAAPSSVRGCLAGWEPTGEYTRGGQQFFAGKCSACRSETQARELGF